jgi:hypothetical protein
MFTPSAVVTADNTWILLKHVESISVVLDNDEYCVIDKLKDDLRMCIRTVSGKEYIISMRYQMSIFEGQNPPNTARATRA